MHIVRVAILECDTPFRAIRDRYDTYGQTFEDLLNEAAKYGAEDSEDVKLSFQSWDVCTAGEYPDPSQVDAIFLTGSQYNAFDKDEWILKLVDFVQEFYATGKPMVGVCFGHQIIARSMGASVARNPKGREISVCDLTLAGPGQKLFGKEKLSLHQSHQDAVLSLPENLASLGSSPACAIQGLFQDGRVLTLQGHPEFNAYIMRRLLDAKNDAGLLTDHVFKDGSERADHPQDGLLVGSAILKFLAGSA